MRGLHIDAYNISLQIYREKSRARRQGDIFRVLYVPRLAHPRIAAVLVDTFTTIDRAVLLVGAQPPVMGTNWTSHSVRKSPASASINIGVPVTHIKHFGGWARNFDVVLDYIDANVLPNPGGWFFYGFIAPVKSLQLLLAATVPSPALPPVTRISV
eukprot:jgi/Tetstr1/462664/TSEL_000692.t1